MNCEQNKRRKRAGTELFTPGSQRPATRRARRYRSSVGTLLLFLLILLRSVPAVEAASGNSSLTDESLREVRFEQKLNQQVTLDLPFRDDNGGDMTLGRYFVDGKPIVLVLGYYECPMLCSLVFNGMIETLRSIKPAIGTDFEVVVVSIDPAETSTLAALQKRTYLQRYGRSGAADGLHFLTGEASAVEQLADEVGFRYAYDPAIQEYAHPSGFVLLTPDGRVARYFFGVTYDAKDLSEALRQTERNAIGSRIEQLVLLCFHYSPLTGKYADLIMGGVRVGAAGTLLTLGWVIGRQAWRRRKLETDGGNCASGSRHSGEEDTA